MFRNKYEQDPSTVQVARGVELLNRGDRTQLQFLNDFALENAVLSVGSYNYTQTDSSGSSLAIPNVPLDVAAFGETALVYSALIGKAPSREEVARLTLTPQYEVRPMEERSRMIMEMPEFASRYGLAMPEVSFIGVPNGKIFETNVNHTLSLEAVSLGGDNLGGTLDDGDIRVVEFYLNGDLNATLDDPNSPDGYFYMFTLDSSLPSGEYHVEVVAEDVNGLRSRVERWITVAHEDDPKIELVSPEIGSILYHDKTYDFSFTADTNVTAYLEVDGRIPWRGRLGFDGTGLPLDESNITISDGTGRSITFEFDSNESASDTQIDGPITISQVGPGLDLDASSYYRGTEYREYLIEIDGKTPNTTFRWSIDGGLSFNEEKVEVPSTPGIYSLSAGVIIDFDDFSSSSNFALGDRWKIKAYPVNQMVEVAKIGTFNDRLATTKRNLIEAINRARNEGKLAIYARDMENSNIGGFPMQSLNRRSIELIHDGSYAVREAIGITESNASSSSPNSYMIGDEILGLVSANGTEGNLTLDLKDLSALKPVMELRVVGFSANGTASYSEPRYFAIRDGDRLYAEMIDPLEEKREGRQSNHPFNRVYQSQWNFGRQ